MPKTILFVVGARPNFMKTAPVYRAVERAAPAIKLVLAHTGQHYDEQMSRVFIGELALPEPDAFLGVGSGSHGEQTARALVGVESVIVDARPDLVVVAGDVNSTLAAALAAVKLRVPVAHIESGLRSFDESMPEEHNRRLTDHVCEVLLAHSPDALENLAREGIDSSRVHLVGNTMIDSVFQHLPRALAEEPWRAYGLEERGFALVTLHRPALVEDPQLLAKTMTGLRELSGHLPVLFPVHPRTRARIEALGSDGARGALVLTEPLGYMEFLGLEARARLVLTDSGGVQEETSALGTPCFTLRDSTERPVTITHGTNTLLGAQPDRIIEIVELVEDTAESQPIPLWDGEAGPRAADVLLRFLADR
jgi:UDP-N-acetylglucosamine 2-epimerase (non-hydrolysing)